MHPVPAFFLDNAKDMMRLGLTFPFRYVKMLLSDPYYVSVRGVGPICIRKKSNDLWVTRQVFRTRQYELGHFPQADRISKRYRQILESGKIPLIIDAGANNGCSALWFAKKFPQSKVVAIEPDPENCEMARINTKANPSITVIEAAVGGTPGSVTLANPFQETWGIQTRRGGTGKKVEIRTINDIIASCGPECELFLAKIDIEGFETDVFSANTEWLSKAMVVIVELHDWMLPGQFSSLAFQRAIAQHKFEIMISIENLIYIGDFDPALINAQLQTADAK
jgi:FkbM family methyltransferase